MLVKVSHSNEGRVDSSKPSGSEGPDQEHGVDETEGWQSSLDEAGTNSSGTMDTSPTLSQGPGNSDFGRSHARANGGGRGRG